MKFVHVLKLYNNGEWYHQTAFYFKHEFLKYHLSSVNFQFQEKNGFIILYL